MRPGGAILAVDAARVLGWAYGRPGEVPRSGSETLAPSGSDNGTVGAGLARWLIAFSKVNQVDALYMEAPLDPRHMGGKTTMATARALIGIIYGLEMIAEMRGIFYRRESPAGEVRAFFIGKHGGRMDRAAWKAAALRQCKILRWPVVDDNAAEACGLWAFACSIEVPKAPIETGPLFVGIGDAEVPPDFLSRPRRPTAQEELKNAFKAPAHRHDDIEEIPD